MKYAKCFQIMDYRIYIVVSIKDIIGLPTPSFQLYTKLNKKSHLLVCKTYGVGRIKEFINIQKERK